MRRVVLIVLGFVMLCSETAHGAIEHVRFADGSSHTLYEIEIPAGIDPEQIDSVTILLNDTPLPFGRDDFSLWGFGSFLEAYLWVPGKPARGSYTFIISTGGAPLITYDTQSVLRDIPNADASTLSIQGSTFSWSPVSFPQTPLYYRLIIEDLSGNRVYGSPRELNMLSHTVPADKLVPGQTYRWHVRVGDAADWTVEQNRSNSRYIEFQYLGGITGMSVLSRKWGDGTTANRVVFQLKDSAGMNVTGSLAPSDIKIYDPNGQQVNISELALPPLSIVRYDAGAGAWNAPALDFDPWANAYFSDPLLKGVYTIEVMQNGVIYRGTAPFNGATTLPIVDASTFSLTEEAHGNLIWSWQVPESACSGGTTFFLLITVSKQTNVSGHFFFVGPIGQCIDSLPLAASFVESLHRMGDEFSLRVEIRTVDNNSSTMSLPMVLTRLAPPAPAQIKGKITDALTGVPISGATILLEPGAITLTSQKDGAFSSSGIPSGTYSVQISANNYSTKTLSGIALAPALPNQLNVLLTPYAPRVTSAVAEPSSVSNDGLGKTLLTVRATHPQGPSSVAVVLGDLSQIGGSLEQFFYDDGTNGDLSAGDGTYSYSATIAKGTMARLCALNVTAVDMAGKEGFGSILLNVTDKLSGTVQPEQSVSQNFDNTLGGQTLNIHFDFTRAVSSLKALRADCQIELTILGPDGSQYGPYYGADAIDVNIPNAPAGQWEYVTSNPCASALSYEIETSGSGTGMLVGRVVDGMTGSGLAGASINCNTGGATVSLAQGYYSGVAVAGTGVVTTAKTGYRTNVRSAVHVKSGATTHLNIQVLPENASIQAAPSGAKVLQVLDPAEDPQPPTQPFALKISGINLEFNVIFPRYQQAVDLYLAFIPHSGEHAGKLFLIDETNSLVEFTGPLLAWKTASSQEESGQIPIPGEYLYGDYTLYSLVTTDSSSLTNYDLSYFSTTPTQLPPAAQYVTLIPSPSEEPNPLTQPLAAKVTDGNLVLNVHFPQQREPVSIFLAYTTPGGALHLIKSDHTTERFSGTLWPWRQDVTVQQDVQVLSMPTAQMAPGVHSFYSLVTTDPAALSNYDLFCFSMSVAP